MFSSVVCQCQYGDMRKKDACGIRWAITIQEIMPGFIQRRAWLSRILAFLLDPVSKSELAFFPDDRFASRSWFSISQEEKLVSLTKETASLYGQAYVQWIKFGPS